MPAYTVEYCDNHLDSLLDKLGSELFPMPIKMGRFVTSTYDFIRENTKWLEVNQEVSDDLNPLVVRNQEVVIIPSVNNSMREFKAAQPIDYLRLISLLPYIQSGETRVQRARLCKIVKIGQEQIMGMDPFDKPTPEYPHITRSSNMFQINFGNNTELYTNAYLSYIKKPTFANIENENAIIVNLPDSAIEQILLKTAESLRFTTADESSQAIYQFDQTFGKRNR